MDKAAALQTNISGGGGGSGCSTRTRGHLTTSPGLSRRGNPDAQRQEHLASAVIMALGSKAFAAALLFIAMVLPRRALSSDQEKDWSGQPYIYLRDSNSKRCFIVTVGSTSKPGGSFHVHYYLRSNNEMDPKVPGSEYFQTTEAGTYSVCASVLPEKRAEEPGMKLSLDFDAGPEDKMFDKLQTEFTLNDAEISMVRVRRNVQDLRNKADFIQEKEVEYHKKIIKLNREVALWPVLQVVILVATGYYQVRHLKQFFKAKRLV